MFIDRSLFALSRYILLQEGSQTFSSLFFPNNPPTVRRNSPFVCSGLMHFPTLQLICCCYCFLPPPPPHAAAKINPSAQPFPLPYLTSTRRGIAKTLLLPAKMLKCVLLLLLLAVGVAVQIFAKS